MTESFIYTVPTPSFLNTNCPFLDIDISDLTITLQDSSTIAGTLATSWSATDISITLPLHCDESRTHSMRIRGTTSGTLEWLTEIFTLTTTNTYTVEDDLPLQLETEIDLFELFESNGLCSVTGFRISRDVEFAEV
jgi:hypothetical protein